MVSFGSMLWIDPESHSVNSTVTHYAHRGNQQILAGQRFTLLIILGYGAAIGSVAPAQVPPDS